MIYLNNHYISSVESQKGAINIKWCSIENQKGVTCIAYHFVCNFSKWKLAVGKVRHQKGVVKFCERIGRTRHITISNAMLLGLSLALSLFKMYGETTLLMLNRTLLNCINVLLVLSWCSLLFMLKQASVLDKNLWHIQNKRYSYSWICYKVYEQALNTFMIFMLIMI